jgi:hypothetical protein
MDVVELRAGPLRRSAAALGLFALIACGNGDDVTQPPPQPAPPGVAFERLAVGDVELVFDARGIIGQDPRTGNGLGIFPRGSSNNYVFGTGLWVAGVVNGVQIVSTGYDVSGGFSEFAPGRDSANGGGADQILCSDGPADLRRWYPEFSDARSGSPIVVGDLDCVVIYNDARQSRDVSTPIGLEVRQRVSAFTSGLAAQVVLVVWDILKTGTSTSEQTFFAVGADFDIGPQFTDDRCSVIPFVPPGRNNPGGTPLKTDLAVCWDHDFQEAGFDPSPGFVGITFLSGPGEPLAPALSRFTLAYDRPGQRPRRGPDGITDLQQYVFLSGGSGFASHFIDSLPADQKILGIAGPVRFEPGTVRRVVVAYIWADASAEVKRVDVDPNRCFPEGPCLLPDPNDPVLEELLQVQREAERLAATRIPAVD